MSYLRRLAARAAGSTGAAPGAAGMPVLIAKDRGIARAATAPDPAEPPQEEPLQDTAMARTAAPAQPDGDDDARMQPAATRTPLRRAAVAATEPDETEAPDAQRQAEADAAPGEDRAQETAAPLRRAAVADAAEAEDEAEEGAAEPPAGRLLARMPAPTQEEETEQPDATAARAPAAAVSESDAETETPVDDDQAAAPARRVLLRRTEDATEEETVQAARGPAPEELTPETAPKLPPETVGEPEPNDLRALRRAGAPVAAPGHPADAGRPKGIVPPASALAAADSGRAADAGALPPPISLPAVHAGPVDRSGPNADGVWPPLPQHQQPALGDAFEARMAGFERPQVVIDRLDVLIHEPAAPAERPARGRGGDLGRSLRARYLRRL